MIKTINPSIVDPETLALIERVFLSNNITHPAKDYAVVKVEDILTPERFSSENTYLYLAPISTNSPLPILRLPYIRRTLEITMQGLTPFFYDATETTVVSDIIGQINDSLEGALVLKKEDFYDTCLIVDNGDYYIRLFAHPNSLFYRGNKFVLQRSRTDPLHLSFVVTLTPQVP